MPSFALTRAQFEPLKRATLQQLPEVRRGHVLEALARAFNFQTWAALNAHLKADTSTIITELSLASMRARLEELGHTRESTQHLRFDHVAHLSDRTLSMVMRPIGTRRDAITLDTVTASGLIQPEQAMVLSALIAKGSVIVVSGSTGTGRSTLATAVLTEMARRSPALHFGFFQQVRELPVDESNVTHYEVAWEGSRSMSPKHSPCDVPVIDDPCGPRHLRGAVKAWRRHGRGLIVVHAATGRAIDRLHAIGCLDGTAAARAVASHKTLRGLVDAVVHLDRQRSRPCVSSIQLRGEF